MGNVLIKFDGNWADEMDVQGFDILSDEEWEYKKLEAANTEFPQEIGIGTNEEILYESVNDYLSDFKVKEISDKEIEVLRKFFGNYSFGHVCYIEGNAPDAFYEEHGTCP